MRRVVKVNRSDLNTNPYRDVSCSRSYVDVSKIVSISEPYNEYYIIYFDNAIWNVYKDSYEEVMEAWLNPDKECIPQDLVGLIRRKQN